MLTSMECLIRFRDQQGSDIQALNCWSTACGVVGFEGDKAMRIICPGLPICVSTDKVRPVTSSDLLAYMYLNKQQLLFVEGPRDIQHDFLDGRESGQDVLHRALPESVRQEDQGDVPSDVPDEQRAETDANRAFGNSSRWRIFQVVSVMISSSPRAWRAGVSTQLCQWTMVATLIAVSLSRLANPWYGPFASNHGPMDVNGARQRWPWISSCRVTTSDRSRDTLYQLRLADARTTRS